MTIRAIAAIVASTVGFVCLTSQLAAAQSATQNDSLRVLVSNGMKGSLEELRPQCEKAVGRSLAIQFGSTAALKKRIEMGEAFDVTIITTEAIGDLRIDCLADARRFQCHRFRVLDDDVIFDGAL